MPRPALLFALACLACDPATADKPAAGKPAPAVVEARTDVSGDRAGLASCLGTCDDGKLSATDQETCRLNCKQSIKVEDPMSAADRVREVQLASFADCAAACSGTERAACLAGCSDAAPELRPVADSLATCVQGCGSATGQSETDRATCKLNCRAAAGSTLAHPPAQ